MLSLWLNSRRPPHSPFFWASYHSVFSALDLVISQINTNLNAALLANPKHCTNMIFTTNTRFPQRNVLSGLSQDAELNMKWNVRMGQLLSNITCETLIENGTGLSVCFIIQSFFFNLPWSLFLEVWYGSFVSVVKLFCSI